MRRSGNECVLDARPVAQRRVRGFRSFAAARTRPFMPAAFISLVAARSTSGGNRAALEARPVWLVLSSTRRPPPPLSFAHLEQSATSALEQISGTSVLIGAFSEYWDSAPVPFGSQDSSGCCWLGSGRFLISQ